MRSKLVGMTLALTLSAVTATAQTAELDAGLKAYAKVSGVSGNVSSIGSDTLNNLMTLWAEGFQKQYPNVRIQIEGKGSSTAPPALIAGSAQFGPMSRAMKANELDEFEKKYGYKPTELKVALDALAVYVHKDNPVAQLSVAQVDGIFSKTRRCGGSAAGKWGDVGVKDPVWASKPISLYGRNSASGTYGFFKEKALCGGDYRDQVKEQPGSASVVQGVTEDSAGVGYSGIGYKTSGVRAVPLAAKAGAPAYDASQEEVNAGRYPLARFLYVYVNKAPGKTLDPLVGEFMRYVCSKEGQQVVVKDGYFPLTSAVCQAELAKLN